MDVPTIEQGDGLSSTSGSTTQATTDATAGPSVTLSVSDGSTVTLGTEDLQLYLLAIQTFLLLYVTYKEVSR